MLSQAEIKLLIFIFPVTNGASFNFLKTFTAEVVYTSYCCTVMNRDRVCCLKCLLRSGSGID